MNQQAVDDAANHWPVNDPMSQRPIQNFILISDNLNINLNDSTSNNLIGNQSKFVPNENDLYPNSDSFNLNQIRIESTLDRDHRRAVSETTVEALVNINF